LQTRKCNYNQTTVEKLYFPLTSSTLRATDRYEILREDTDFIFDFNKDGPIANRKTFPALVGSGGSMAVGDLARELQTRTFTFIINANVE